MTTDDRTADMALLPAEREMPAEAWLEYGGLPPGLRAYCWRLMRQESDARMHLREAEAEVAEWRDRAWRLLERTGAAEAALTAAIAQARAEGEAAGAARERAAAQVEVDSLRAELAQAQADRALLAGLWLITVPPRELPALLPTDQGDRDRLAAALDAVDRQPGAEARIAAGRAIIARIVAEMGGGAA